ncbi:MAG: hypothetical protein BHW64_05550 [Candidatus Melainabacteria bacterium LEY3_CP_29_8]|nr:MAG: hypothetical protein BHW64_05550 [Candidatus Melainabacteria bacterium LEY3_CP_29_8]
MMGKPGRYLQFANGRKVEYTQICNKKEQQCLYADAVLVAEVIGTEKETWKKVIVVKGTRKEVKLW